MANPTVPGAANQSPVIRASKDDTLRGLAARLYKDERVAELLAQANPGLNAASALSEGTPVRLPDKATTQKWAQRKGITLGLDPNKPTGTKQKRAWNKFQTGPTFKVVTNPIGPEAPIVQLLATPAPNVTGAGVLTPEVLKDPNAIRMQISERIQWLGADRVLEASAKVNFDVLAKRAEEVAVATKEATDAGTLVEAVLDNLVELLSLDALKEARKLFARAQQALGVTANDEHGGLHLFSALKEADPDARIKLLSTLGVPKATASSVSDALDRVPTVKSCLMGASVKSGKERQAVLSAIRLPPDRIAAVINELQPPLDPLKAEMLALRALGLEGAAAQAREGASAMHQLVQKAITAMKTGIDGPTALVGFKAARASMYKLRGVTIPPDSFPPEEGESERILDQALIQSGEGIAAQAKKLHEAIRVAWRSVEALGPQLADVDASALGRGIGAILARMTPGPVPAAPEEVKKLRAGDLLSMGGAAALRAQAGVEVTRTLAPAAAGLAAVVDFPYVLGMAAPTARMELRRRLTDEFRANYAVTPNLPASSPSGDEVKRALQSLLGQAQHLVSVWPDAVDRATRLKALVDKGPFCDALARTCGPARYKFRRDEISSRGKWLCAAAWLLDHARDAASPDAQAQAVHKLLGEDGGRLLDAAERALLRKLG